MYSILIFLHVYFILLHCCIRTSNTTTTLYYWYITGINIAAYCILHSIVCNFLYYITLSSYVYSVKCGGNLLTLRI